MNIAKWLPGDPDVDGFRASGANAPLQLPDSDVWARRDHKSLCIACALTNHDFKQRMPTPAYEAIDEEHMPKAWVDGRRYRMAHHPSPLRAACSDCGDRVYIVYEPEQ